MTLKDEGLNPRALGTNPIARGSNPRALGQNPRAMGVDPRALGLNPKALGLNPKALGIDVKALRSDPLFMNPNTREARKAILVAKAKKRAARQMSRYHRNLTDELDEGYKNACASDD